LIFGRLLHDRRRIGADAPAGLVGLALARKPHVEADARLPEALANYLLLLGWSYDDHTEIFSRDEMIEKFDIARVNPSPARYNYEKLGWFNQYYINHIIELDDLTQRCIPFLQAAELIGDAPEGSSEYTHARDAIALINLPRACAR
jgi:glutamyl/glutaminyl-tRNA synthetase